MEILIPLIALVLVILYLATEGRRQNQTWQEFRRRKQEKAQRPSPDQVPDPDSGLGP